MSWNKIIECVPNFSEGRDLEKIDQIVAPFRIKAGVKLLDYSNDEDHNRLVVTLVGEPEALYEAIVEAVGVAVRLIDLNQHTGQHPRMGAVDVIPFIPIKNTSMEEAIELSKKVAAKAFEILSREECLRRILYQEGMEVTTPTKLYKRALFEGVRYPVGKLYEDIQVAYEVTKRAHKVAHIANRDYYYFQRGSSIQNMAFNPRKLDSVRHCHALMENVKRDFPQLSRAAECRYLSNVCNILFQIQDRQHEKIEKALWQEVKKYRWNVLLDPQARKKARLAAALSYSGYAMTRRVYEKTQWRGKK